MKMAEIQALCDAMAGAVIAVDASGRVVAANDNAKERTLVVNGGRANGHDAPASDADFLSVEAVFDRKLATAVRAALEAGLVVRRGEESVDERIAVLPCDDERVALVMERPAAQIGAAQTARDAGLDALAMLAHDLRGALSNVCGVFALLDEDLADDPRHGARVAAMRGALAHFSDLIGAALDLEALAAGEISVRLRDVDLQSFADEIQSIWGARFAEIDAQLHVEVDERAPLTVRADPMRLRQVVFNLLRNAETHSRARNVRVRISALAGAAPDDAWFSVAVEDDGIGLPEHVLTRMREESLRALFGAGRRRLGLSVVQDVARAMGGLVSCCNLDRGGARICVTAPVGDAEGRMSSSLKFDGVAAGIDSLEAAAASGGLSAALAKGGISGLKALLAEDNATNQLVATQMLDKLGCAVEVASDGVEAVEMLGRGQYDFLLVDIEMPKMSGIDVLRHLRAGKAGRPDLPAIALTAYAMAEHRRKVADAGADGMIAKPIMGVKSFETDIVEILGRVQKVRKPALLPAEARPEKDAARGLPEPDIDQDVFGGLISVIGEDAADEFLERVETDLADVRLRIRNGARKGDLAEIRAGAHVLISVAGAIGARTLQTIAETLHAHAAKGALEDARALVKEGDAQFMAVAAFIYKRRAGAL